MNKKTDAQEGKVGKTRKVGCPKSFNESAAEPVTNHNQFTFPRSLLPLSQPEEFCSIFLPSCPCVSLKLFFQIILLEKNFVPNNFTHFIFLE